MGGERVMFGIKGAPVLQNRGTKPIARPISWDDPGQGTVPVPATFPVPGTSPWGSRAWLLGAAGRAPGAERQSPVLGCRSPCGAVRHQHPDRLLLAAGKGGWGLWSPGMRILPIADPAVLLLPHRPTPMYPPTYLEPGIG